MPLAVSQPSVTKLLPLMEFYMHGIVWYIMFCVCLLSLGLMLLRFICVVVPISRSFLCVAD